MCIRDSPRLKPKDFMLNFADPSQPVWNGLQRVWNDVHEIDWIYNEDSPYFNRNSILKAALENSVNADDFKGLASGKAIIDVPSAVKEKIEEVEEILTRELKEEARVISEQDLTLEQKQEQLKTIRDAIIEDEKLEFQLELKALQKQKASTSKGTFDSVYKDLFNDGKGKSKTWEVLTNGRNTKKLEALWNPDLIGKALYFQEAARTQTGSFSEIEMPSDEDIEKDINKWVAMEEKLENPDQMIDFQTEYTKELHEMSDYPKIDFELIRKHFKEWEHHKVEDISTYRNKSFSSPVTGSVAPIHHTPWATAMDDSSKTFLDK